MSKKRGLTFDQKREKLQEIFHESKDFYQLKELEKLGPKLKGIVQQSVKEVLDSLVADNLVNLEKIGTSNYYWSFPSTALVTRENKIKAQELEIADQIMQIERLEFQLNQARHERQDSDERREKENKLNELSSICQSLLKEIQKYADNDPELFEKKKAQVLLAKNAANRWTENLFTLQSYCKQKFNLEQQVFTEQFGIPEDLDTFS